MKDKHEVDLLGMEKIEPNSVYILKTKGVSDELRRGIALHWNRAMESNGSRLLIIPADSGELEKASKSQLLGMRTYIEDLLKKFF